MMQAVYVSDEFGIISSDSVETLTERIPFLASGASRNVYDLGNAVLKVNQTSNHWAGGCLEEIEVWETYQGTEHEHLFCRILAADPDGQWAIMEKVTGTLGDHGLGYCTEHQHFENVMLSLGIRDQHEHNVGIREDGSWCSIDYAFQNGRPLGEPATLRCSCGECSNGCDCGDHDCRDCYRDGCECCCSRHKWEGCGDLSGCNQTVCSHGWHTWRHNKACGNNAVVRVNVLDTLRGIVEHVFCEVHNPNPDPVQCDGQGRFVIDIQNHLVPDAVVQQRTGWRCPVCNSKHEAIKNLFELLEIPIH